jgi:hypothetical protein
MKTHAQILDRRTAMIYVKKKPSFIAVHITLEFPPNVRAQMTAGFRTISQFKSYCAIYGLAVFKCYG